MKPRRCQDAATGAPAPEAGAPEHEIEITPEMIEAGIEAIAYAFRGHGETDDFEDIAIAVYSAMRLRSPDSESPSELKNKDAEPSLSKSR
jgi:hypothetical protein